MNKYIREVLKNLSISLLGIAFPHLVLAGPPPSLDKLIDQKISQMSLDEKVGQLFIVGFQPKEITPDLAKFITRYKPGSFLLFKRNISSAEQIRNLNTELYRISFKNSKLPPLIAIDQEGGSVSRLPIFPAPPSALAIGQTQSPLLSEEIGFQTGRFLREVGFNMNLAPVLDVSDPFSGSFIGVRSFGSDPKVVADVGVAFAKGLLRANVIPTAKHFPGTGSLKADPHLHVVKNTASKEVLMERDLRPFREYSKMGKNIAVMLSHFIYPALDESEEPASFSKKISTSLLREDLQYGGLVVTDDLQMQGSRQLLRPEVAALRALQAGADIVMVTWSFADQGRAFEYVKSAIKKNELSEADLSTKLNRILHAKAFANGYRKSPQQEPLLRGTFLTSTGYSNVESNILESNIKSNLNKSDSSPKEKVTARKPASLGKVCVVSPSRNFVQSFKSGYRKNFSSRLLAREITPSQLNSWVESKNCAVTFAAVTGKTTAALFKGLSLATKKKMVVVNLSSPNLIGEQKEFLRVLQLYFNHADSGKKIAQHLEEILRDLKVNLASN